MRSPLLLVGLVACSSPSDVEEDTFPDPTGAMLVRPIVNASGDGDATTVELTPTLEHSLLVVAIAAEDAVLAMTTDSGRALTRDVSTSLTFNHCGRAFEIWLLADLEADVSSVDIALRAPAMHAVSMFEVAGLSRYVLTTSLNGSVFAPPFTIGSLDVAAGNLVISVIATCSSGVALEPGAGYEAIPTLPGFGLAFYIPTTATQVAATWSWDAGRAQTFMLAYR